MDNCTRIDRQDAAALYHGWLVVAAAFLIAMFGFGLGFYGPGVYFVALEARHGWSVGEISPAITAYYILGATLLFFCVGPLFDRYGTRTAVATGVAAMACGLVLLGLVARPWQVYAAFALMSVGWATMSGAALNIIVAPWFDRRRGLAVSWAFNGASAGGVVAPPLLIFLIARLGLSAALAAVAAAILVVLVPVAALVLRPKRADERDLADRISAAEKPSPSAEPRQWHLATVMRSRNFIMISVPFALGLTAQVGFLTHQIAYLSPLIGNVAAGWSVSLTTFAAVIGRIAGGFVVDRLDCRAVACGNFVIQALGMGVLAGATGPVGLYCGCVLVGLGVGNATSLPGLIVHAEFPNQHFSRVVGLVVAINQFSFAFGPSLLGELRYLHGDYTGGLLACLAMEAIAATIVVLPVIERFRHPLPTGLTGRRGSEQPLPHDEQGGP
jgi:MFS family permease